MAVSYIVYNRAHFGLRPNVANEGSYWRFGRIATFPEGDYVVDTGHPIASSYTLERLQTFGPHMEIVKVPDVEPWMEVGEGL